MNNTHDANNRQGIIPHPGTWSNGTVAEKQTVGKDRILHAGSGAHSYTRREWYVICLFTS